MAKTASGSDGENSWEILKERSKNSFYSMILRSDVMDAKEEHKAGEKLTWENPQTQANAWHYLMAKKRSTPTIFVSILKKHSKALFDQPLLADEEFEDKVKAKKGQTPLHLACQKMNKKMVRILLEMGADVNRQDEQGHTPMALLAKRWGARAEAKAMPVFELLMTHKADPGIQNHKGQTPLQIMASKGPLPMVLKLLQDRPEDVGGESKVHKNALKSISERGEVAHAGAEQAMLKTILKPISQPITNGSGGDSSGEGEASGSSGKKRRSL